MNFTSHSRLPGRSTVDLGSPGLIVVVVVVDAAVELDLLGLESPRAGTTTHCRDFPTRVHTNVELPCTLVRPMTAHALLAYAGCETDSTDAKTLRQTTAAAHLTIPTHGQRPLTQKRDMRLTAPIHTT